MTALTTAYAGHGDTTAENIPAVLDTFLPQDLGMVYIPARVPRYQSGLKKVVTWLESEVGKDGTIPVPDLIEALLQRNKTLADEGKDLDDLALVMLYDDSKDEDVALARAAHDAGIRVVDLTKAGDDLLLDDATVTFEETPVEEPVPDEPERPVAGEEETPPWEGDKPAKEPAGVPAPVTSPAEAVAKATELARLAGAAHSGGAPLSLVINVPLGQDFIDALAHAVVKAMGGLALASMGAVEAETPAEPSKVSHIKSAGAGDDQPDGTKPYYYDKDKGTYRPARGMARKTEDKVFLDAREIQALKESKLLA